MLKRYLLCALLILPQMLMAQKATITVESRDILTYPYGDPNPVPVLAEGRSGLYPYHTFNGYSLTGQTQKHTVIKLENEFIEVYILPNEGGKVWGAIEKSTGLEFIYRNEVMKYRNIAMRGPWTSGGIELNFGFIGHNPSTASPVDYQTFENADGSVSCIVGSIDLPSRTLWRVEIRLPKDKAYFETRNLWNNPTPLPQSYYNWMTASAVVTDDLEFQYPGNQELGHDGYASPWPIDREGRDISKYANNAFGYDKSYHVVGEYNDFMGGYYHKSKFGYGHWALYDEMPGRKLWLWSQARSGAIWENLLTDTDGQYMEFQAGRTLNQYSPNPSLKTPITQIPFSPELTDRWKEIWFPVKEIGGFKEVSPVGALNVSHEKGQLEIGINALAFVQAKLNVKSEGKIIYAEDIKFKPMDVFIKTIPLSENAAFEINVEGMDLYHNSEKRNLISRPFVTSMTVDKTMASSLYFEGMEEKENRGYNAAKVYFQKCLLKDPYYIDAMAALTEIYYRRMLYDSALYYANIALQLDAYHPAANYFAGITYRAQGNIIDALETMGWAARSMEYRSAAYEQMAGIELKLNNKELVEYYANLSLDFNRCNFDALKILAILYRLTGETALADKNLDAIKSLDPLNHFADFERYILHPTNDNFTKFTATIKNEFPYQTYLEVCLDYYQLGLKNDALSVLDKAPAHSLITIWKAYLKDDPAILNESAKESPAYVFPYRTETALALSWAVSKNDSWKFKYYLALNLWAIQREKDAVDLFKACGQEPDYAPFYLSRAALLKSDYGNQELNDLQSALRLAPDEWRAHNKLVEYYEHSDNQSMALTASSAAYKKFRSNPIIALQHATSLLNNGQYANCIKILEGMVFLPNEGSSVGKVVYEQAYILLALDLMKNKKYKDALTKLDKAREWPESLGVGEPYEPDNRLQDYLSAYCLTKLKRTDEAAEKQNAVLEYSAKHFSRRSSLYNILSLWIYKDKGETDKANKLLQKISSLDNAKNPVQQWVIASFKNDSATANKLEKNFSGNRYFEIIKKIAELK
jgi:hypothetical protein